MPKMAFSITDTHIIFGTETGVENAIRTLADSKIPSLESAKWFNRAKSDMPSIVGAAGMEDTSLSFELIWWMMKEGSKTQTGGPMGPNPIAMFAKEFDLNFSLLPEYEAVKKYFGLAVSYAVTRPDGFLLEGKNLDSGK
jgi:hypothetical protein